VPRALKLLLLLAPLTMALIALVDTPYHRLSTQTLFGVVQGTGRPRASFHRLWTGAFQAKFEAWLAQELSFKALMVRTDNTINLVAFGDISARTGIPVILGKDNTLFEMNYVNNTNGVSDVKGDPPPKSSYTVDEDVRRLSLAARAFRRLGIDFVVLFYPSKAWIWRERLPQRYRLPGGAKRAQAGYEALLSGLKKYDVPVVDGVDAYERLARRRPSFPLYNRGGTHWTEVGACEVAKRIVTELSNAGRSKLLCEQGPEPGVDDADLASLINVWDRGRFVDPVPQSKPSLNEPLPDGPRDALIVGTSFSRHLIGILQAAGVLREAEHLAYYRHSDRRALRWRRLLRGKKLVIFEQWQWSFITANVSEFLDDLEQNDRRFAAALSKEKRNEERESASQAQ